MKRIALFLLAAAMILTLAVSASAFFEQEEAFCEVKFEIGKQTTAWNPDGTITDGEYFKVNIKPEWLSYAINDNDTDAGLAYAKATTPELYMSWDENYVYTATRYTVSEGHECLWDSDPASMWYSGAVQFNYANFDEVASDYRLEYGVGLSSETGDTLYTVWAQGGGDDYEPGPDDAKVWLDGNTLTYETRVPWDAFADEDNTGRKEGNGFNTTLVWSIGKGQDYVHIQLAEGCTGSGKHAEYMAQVTLVGAAPVAYTPVGDVSVPYATPEIDGTIKDGEYPEVGKVTLNQSNMTALGWLGEVPAENSIDLYCAWDRDNFYVAGNVTDPYFEYSEEGQYNMDAFQVSLNIDNIFKSDEYQRAIFYSWGLQEDGNIDVIRQESANDATVSDLGKGQKTDTGWTFEVALPLEMLAEDASLKAGEEAIPEPGMPIGGLFCYLDHDEWLSLVNAYGSCADEVVGWDPDAHGITFIFAEKEGAAGPTELLGKSWDNIYIDGEMMVNGGADGWLAENPIEGDISELTARGWAYISTPITGFAYAIDGGDAVKSADYIVDRPDVKAAISEEAEGLEIAVDVSGLDLGAHTIKFYAVDANDELIDIGFDLPFTKAEAAPEEPSRGLADVDAAADGKNLITAYEFVSGTDSFGGEGPENLWDGETGTKFCTNVFPAESIVKLDGTYDITGFTMATANDNADYNGRSPNAWTISVSADGENWTELAKGDDTFFEETNFTYYVGEGTAAGVSYVKFNAEGTASGTFQVSEVTLFGDKAADVTEELTTKEEAPNTFDFGIVAAVAAVVSLAGFAISKKH
ncbi:MAG: discoidin domain-containing protein [Clostridia bacterium]|nr:discoidin domain-containing protein [Clostridia bacterium]